MKPIHVLIIPSWYPQNSNDIGGSFFREQALALHKQNIKVGVICPQMRSIRDIKGCFTKPYGLQIENDNGIDTLRWHNLSIPKMQRLNRSRWLSVGMKLFDTYIKQYGIPDVIHAHSLLNGGILAYQIHIKFSIPYIITEHSSSFIKGHINIPTISTLIPVVNNASSCLAVSNQFAQSLNKTFQTNKWEYLPNIVNNIFIEADLAPNKYETFTFINICMLNSNKNVDLIIKAFSKVAHIDSRLHLKIGGDGPEHQSLINLTNELNLNQQITFLGMLSREEVLKEIQQSNAFVLSSKFETFGVVLIEALALGKPVIATKCGGPESIITSEVGYLVDSNSIDQFALTMQELYENYSKFDNKKIREYCKDNFSEAAVTKQLIHLYQAVLHK